MLPGSLMSLASKYRPYLKGPPSPGPGAVIIVSWNGKPESRCWCCCDPANLMPWDSPSAASGSDVGPYVSNAAGFTAVSSSREHSNFSLRIQRLRPLDGY